MHIFEGYCVYIAWTYRHCIPYAVTLGQRRKNDQGLPHGTMESEQPDGATGACEHESLHAAN